VVDFEGTAGQPGRCVWIKQQEKIVKAALFPITVLLHGKLARQHRQTLPKLQKHQHNYW
jgi:hypothetical protein